MDCPTLDELYLDEWSTGLLAKLRGRRYPLSGMFELTDRCNLGCVHCYINQPATNQAARDSELTTSQVKKILDQLVEAGCLFLTFTGGEVLLRSDFTEIYQYARQLGILVTIFTNATLLTPRIADLLAESRPRLVEVTLYGATRETYEKVTGVAGSYDRCMRGIDLLVERNLSLNLKSILLSINLHELPAMRAFAEQRGLDFRYDGLLWPRLDGCAKPFDYRLSLQELLALDDGNPERQAEWERIAASYSGQALRAEYVFSCGAGLQSFHIDSTGKLSICTMARHPAYDLNRTTFNEAWERLGDLRKLKREKTTICQTCTLGGLCSQCPGWSQSVHGDNETPVEFLCELAHFRAARVKECIM